MRPRGDASRFGRTIEITDHALIRWLERSRGFEFATLRAQYAAACPHSDARGDRRFVAWLDAEKHVDCATPRGTLHGLVRAALELNALGTANYSIAIEPHIWAVIVRTRTRYTVVTVRRVAEGGAPTLSASLQRHGRRGNA